MATLLEEEPTHEYMAHRPRILVAEAEQENRDCMVAALRADGYDVVAVTNGFDLLDELSTALLLGLPAQGPDAIIMDVWMPGVSGLSILGGLRDAGWQTPIVLITGGFGRELRGRSKRIGANAVFEKPFEMDDLRTVVMNLVPHAPKSSTRRSQAPPHLEDGASSSDLTWVREVG
jgi:DNA-binding response OmpR family regulator